MSSESVRAFIAIEIPDGLVEKLRKLQGELKKNSTGISWVKPENIHLTIRFLGNVETGRLSGLTEALERASRGIKPFELSVRGVGGFPSLRGPRVVWVGIEENQTLLSLYRNIEDELSRMGFEREKRQFHPHLTLCRVKLKTEGIKLARRIADLKPEINMDFSVDRFTLFRSILKPSGAEYHVIKHIIFRG